MLILVRKIIFIIILLLCFSALRAQELRPKDIAFELLARIRSPGSENINNIKNAIAKQILTHELNPAQVETLLTNAKKYANILGVSTEWLNDRRFDIMGYPIDLSSPEGRDKLITLWEDPYGRLFDSTFAHSLVKSPPLEVLAAMSLMGQKFADLLANFIGSKTLISIQEQTKFRLELGNELVAILKNDNRFWFRKVPLLWEIYNFEFSTTDAQKRSNDVLWFFDRFFEYLKKRKTNGWEAISVSYIINKMSLYLRDNINVQLPFLTESDKIYVKYFEPLSKGIKEYKLPQLENATKSIYYDGITLPGQKNLPRDYGFVASTRAATTNAPEALFDPARLATDNRVKASEAAKYALVNQLIQGATWGSGLSGSTNISLGAVRWFNVNMKAAIDEKAAFLGILMFLVYDGGHSIADVLWAAFIIDKAFPEFGKAPLDFNFSDIKSVAKAHEFIPNFEKLINLYPESSDLKTRVNEAFGEAFKGVFRGVK